MERLVVLLIAMMLAAGCGGGAQAPAPAADGSAASGAPRPADTLPIPGAEGATGDLPAGHPPVGDVPAGLVVWTTPSDWVRTEPSSQMRFAQYSVPGPGGDAELVVFYFGPNQGGDPMANARRWAGQFEQPGGGSSLDVMQVSTLDGTHVPVQIVEVTGTYDGGMTMTQAPAEKKAGWMLLGGIVQGPDAPWFFKLTGPEATVRAARDGFLGVMRSVHAAG